MKAGAPLDVLAPDGNVVATEATADGAPPATTRLIEGSCELALPAGPYRLRITISSSTHVFETVHVCADQTTHVEAVVRRDDIRSWSLEDEIACGEADPLDDDDLDASDLE